jgi:aminopeptidase N
MLKGWLEGFDVPFGLPIEADRRWAILTSLARLGAIGEQDIVAETRRDPTITGAEAAAGVRSALADPDAKRTAWRLATADPDVPNGTHLAICRQFWQYGQEELLAPYRERYLELCTDIAERRGVWQNRGHAASQAALSWLFPTPLADQTFIDQLDAWVAQHRPSPTVGRVLAEQRDNAARAIRGQELTPGQA